MKKLLFFAILALLLIGCNSGIGGELYLVPPEYIEHYVPGAGWIGSGVCDDGVEYAIYKDNKKVKSGTTKNPIYIQLPTGTYTVHLESVFKNYWEQPTYSDDIEFVIRLNKTTRIDIPFF